MLHRMLIAVSVAVTMMTSTVARAVDFYLDVYGGIASTETNNVHASLPILNQFVTRRIDYDDSTSAGLRFKLWPTRLPWIGYGQDFSFFEAKQGGVDFTAYTTTPMLMLRLPILKTEIYPTGMINPYAGIGPSFAFIKGTIDYRPQLARKISHSTLTTGYQALAGVLVHLDPKIAIFAEYKFTRFTPELEDDKCTGFGSCVTTERVKATLETNHYLVGVAFKF